MPTSSRENAPWALDRIIQSDAQTILDVGAGKGTYASELRAIGYTGHITGSEVWPPYVELFGLRDLYDTVPWKTYAAATTSGMTSSSSGTC